MPTKKFSQMISELPMEAKLIFFGGIITAISVFLPWYQDLDAFKTGDRFFGITGPLYLIGIIMFLLGIAGVLSIISMKWKNRIARLGMEAPVLRIIIASFNLFLLILANSVYFHPKFGVNIILKEFRFGMVLAFIGVGLMLIGGIFEYKKNGVIKWDNLKGEAKPLIDLNETRKHSEIITKEERPLEPIDLGTMAKKSELTDRETRYPDL